MSLHAAPEKRSALSPPLLLAALALLSGCGGGPVGEACEFTVECPSGQSCWTRLDPEIAFPGGVCSLTCERVGRQDRCPSGSVCAQTGGRLLCAQTCSDASACREGYACEASDPDTESTSACVHRP